ncbi:MAG: hypothetical protein LBU08_03080, partial [Tannerellaceae bacterium]|nr:hypothetical protein [Tannerellaceae bacterium]
IQFPSLNLPEHWICNLFASYNPDEHHYCRQCPHINSFHVPLDGNLPPGRCARALYPNLCPPLQPSEYIRKNVPCVP